MALPNFSQVLQSMLTFLQGSRPDINTQTGSVVNDVVCSTVANQLSAQNGTDPSVYSNILYTQELQAFATDAAVLVPSDLDQIGANYGLVRNPAVAATGTITFQVRNYTTSSAIITINAGTTVSTLATSSSPATSFATTSGVTFTPSLAPAYFNPVTGFYEQTTTIICQTTGSVGNVSANTITTLVSSVPGVNSVTNTTATTGGVDQESNTAFAARIQIKLEGNNVGTQDGIISLAETNPAVQQAVVVGPNSPYMLRNQFGGSVDVYIRGQILTTTTDTDSYSVTGSQQFILANQPAVSVTSIIGIVNSNPYTFVPTVDYTFVENPNSLYAGSIESGSYVTFDVDTVFTISSVTDSTHLVVSSTSGMVTGSTLVQGSATTTVTTVTDPTHIVVGNTSGFTIGSAYFTGFKPDNNTNITITYVYDSLISTLQALFGEPSNLLVASDILIKEAEEAFITIVASIQVLPGYNAATVVSNVQTNLTVYINGLGLGPNIDLSDLVVVIEETPGVDQVDLSTLSISSVIDEVTTTVPPGQRLTIPPLAYTFSFANNISIES